MARGLTGVSVSGAGSSKPSFGIAVGDGCRLDSTPGLVHHVDGDSKTFVVS